MGNVLYRNWIVDIVAIYSVTAAAVGILEVIGGAGL
ncbi:hypothetical protein ALCH109712_04795 [Alkalicoccus chagannorensis]